MSVLSAAAASTPMGAVQRPERDRRQIDPSTRAIDRLLEQARTSLLVPRGVPIFFGIWGIRDERTAAVGFRMGRKVRTARGVETES